MRRGMARAPPDPVPEARELLPEMLTEKPRFLCFLFFVLQAG